MSSRLRDPHDLLTCQCCGRAVRAQKGLIAHHGYRRPGWGEIVSSCVGARELPYEADRAALGRLLELLTRHLIGLRDRRAAIDGETAPVPFRYSEHKNGALAERTMTLTRADFDQLYVANRMRFTKYSVHTFDAAKERALRALDNTIRAAELDLREQRRRYDAWKLTHEYADDHWRPL
jgi:hypothetical protein